MRLYIIGAGGTASYLLPVLIRTLTRNCGIEEVVIIDRDEIEEKNVERQNYAFEDVGKSKAQIIADSLKEFTQIPINAINEWYTEDFALFPNSFIVSCTDNHPARLALLNSCDVYNCKAVICGNETFSADAYYYEPSFQNTKKDPRIRYPEIVTDKQDDPTRPPCNDADAIEENPQLAAANFMSANLGMHLIQLWLFELHQFDLKKDKEYLPLELSSALTGIKVLKHQDLKEQQ